MNKKNIIKIEYESIIFKIRGRKVMIDSDLAKLYGVPTKRLKEQVKRNLRRFPTDFMFELTKNEKAELVANCDQFATLKHASVNPMAFTEQGVSMLSSVLRSEKAIQINIEIMRAFSSYRSILREAADLKKDILKLDSKLTKGFKYLLNKIDALHQKNNTEKRNKIGYKNYNTD